MKIKMFPLLVSLGLISFATVRADTVVINPADDAALYVCDGCNPVDDDGYLLVAGYIQGAVKFSTAQIFVPVTQAFLTVNPYGLPLFDLNIDVYGITSDNGVITADDANAGTFLGTWHLPENLGYGEDAFFDVTKFLMSANSDYVGFNLRDNGTDVFSSLEYNYGHPSQLHVTTAPEPTSSVLLAAGIGLLGILKMRRSSARR